MHFKTTEHCVNKSDYKIFLLTLLTDGMKIFDNLQINNRPLQSQISCESHPRNKSILEPDLHISIRKWCEEYTAMKFLKAFHYRHHTIIRPTTFGYCHLAGRIHSKNEIYFVFTRNGCILQRCFNHNCVEKSNETAGRRFPFSGARQMMVCPYLFFTSLQKPQQYRHYAWS